MASSKQPGMRRLSFERPVKLPLDSARRVTLFLIAVGLPAALIAGAVLRVAVAETLGDSLSVADIRRAVSLDPANPRLYHRLGLIYSYSTEDLDPSTGLRNLVRATELNPSQAIYWSDLASACEWARDPACSDRAFTRALNLSPMTPRLHWLAGNHYLRTRRPEEALRQFRLLLEMSPPYAWPTFDLCLGILDDPQLIYEKVLVPGRDARTKLTFLHFLSVRGRAEFAHRVWKEIAPETRHFPFSAVAPYLQRLIDSGRFDEAFQVWNDLERLEIVPKAAADDQKNLVYNGDFELPPLNAGFDWRYTALPFLSLNFSDSGAFRGARCLRLDFAVKRNDDNEPVYQAVPVVPTGRYRLEAFVRSESITSDSGPRLRARNPTCSECLDVSSESTIGTTRWHAVTLNFSTGPKTRLVHISVWRPRSRTFPTEISGEFWLDAVSLTPAGPANEVASSERAR